jgi:hypothetical protein
MEEDNKITRSYFAEISVYLEKDFAAVLGYISICSSTLRSV